MMDSMTCEVFEGLLPRYLEGETGAAERSALEAHAAGCAECGAMLEGIREITRDAGSLPVLEPSRDLWDGIAARIEAPAIPLDSRRIAATSVADARPRSWRHMRLAAAAAVLVIATAGTTHVITRQMIGSENDQTAMVDVKPVENTFAGSGNAELAGIDPVVTPMADSSARTAEPSATAPGQGTGRATAPRVVPAPAGAATGTLVASSTKAEAVYDQEIAILQHMLDQRRAELDPATTVVLENNLRIIDRAIRDSRAALARDPASGFLTEQLTMALDKKLQLMRTAAKLPSRT